MGDLSLQEGKLQALNDTATERRAGIRTSVASSAQQALSTVCGSSKCSKARIETRCQLEPFCTTPGSKGEVWEMQ